jgi:hypothetical protein
MTKGKAYLLIFGSIVWLIGVVVIWVMFSEPPVPGQPKGLPPLFLLVWLGGTVLLFVAGAAVWAGAKGYPPILGALLGFFLSCLGLLIIVFLRDKTADMPKPDISD